LQDLLARLRREVEQARGELIEAEAELADQLAQVNAFELEFEARAGYLWDRLDALEKEIDDYHDRIHLMRHKYLPAERQYRRAWQAPPGSAPTPPPRPVSPADEAHIKRLYRQMARRFHPDLAATDAERAYRTEKMAAVNAAYAARSLVELEALAGQPQAGVFTEHVWAGRTEAQLVEALEKEIARCRQRMREIESELRGLPNRPSVQLGLEVKLARRQGRDLLGEMAADLERKIARKTAERDMLEAQFDRLGPDQGIIRTK
jgi:chromosome segregation ATPase